MSAVKDPLQCTQARRAHNPLSLDRAHAAACARRREDASSSSWAERCGSARWIGRLQGSNHVERASRDLRAVFLRKMTRWPQLLNGTLVLAFLPGWITYMDNFVQVEPLSVVAFAAAVQAAGSGDQILDIGSNLGFYTTLAATLSPPSVRVLAVEMQPRCVDIIQCHLWLNGVAHHPRVQILNRYVTASSSSSASSSASTSSTLSSYSSTATLSVPVSIPAVRVPRRTCDTMASPSATGGRSPDGTEKGTQKRETACWIA